MRQKNRTQEYREIRKNIHLHTPHIPYQPIPRGYPAPITGRYSGSSILALSPAFPGKFPVAHAVRRRLRRSSSLTATRSRRFLTCFPFHRTRTVEKQPSYLQYRPYLYLQQNILRVNAIARQSLRHLSCLYSLKSSF